MSVANCLFLVSKSDYIDLNKLCEEIIENKIEVYMPYFLYSYISICTGTVV